MAQEGPRRRKTPARRPSREIEPMLTVAEVAERVGTTPVTIRRWLLAGKLAGVRPGGTKLGWRIPLSEVERILTPRRRGEDN
jgi:excisionase family DNA binding protein